MILVNLTTEEAAGKIRAWNLVDFICYAPLKHHYFYGPQFILCGIFRRREYTTFGDKCVQMSLATRKLCACVCLCVCVWMAAMGEGRRTPSTMCKNPSKWLCTRMAIHSLETGEYKLYVSVTSLSVVKRQKVVVRNESRMLSLSVMASSLVNSNWIHIGINVALTHIHTHTWKFTHRVLWARDVDGGSAVTCQTLEDRLSLGIEYNLEK